MVTGQIGVRWLAKSGGDHEHFPHCGDDGEQKVAKGGGMPAAIKQQAADKASGRRSLLISRLAMSSGY
jgi:hypothetical protein